MSWPRSSPSSGPKKTLGKTEDLKNILLLFSSWIKTVFRLRIFLCLDPFWICWSASYLLICCKNESLFVIWIQFIYAILPKSYKGITLQCQKTCDIHFSITGPHKIKMLEAAVRRFSSKFRNIHMKTFVLESLFTKVAGLHAFLLKRDTNTDIFKNTFFTEYLWWIRCNYRICHLWIC